VDRQNERKGGCHIGDKQGATATEEENSDEAVWLKCRNGKKEYKNKRWGLRDSERKKRGKSEVILPHSFNKNKRKGQKEGIPVLPPFERRRGAE